MAMLAACRVPNKVVRKATRVRSRDGAGAQAAAMESRWRKAACRSCAGVASRNAADCRASRSIEFLPPPSVLGWGVAEGGGCAWERVFSCRAAFAPEKGVRMRRPLSALLFSAGCTAGSRGVQRDDRLYRALAQQE